MRAYRYLAALLLLVAAACATLPQNPQQLINEARAELIAAVRLNRTFLNERVITSAEHDAKLAKIEKLEKDLAEVEGLISIGQNFAAMEKAQIAHKLAFALHAELKERSNK